MLVRQPRTDCARRPPDGAGFSECRRLVAVRGATARCGTRTGDLGEHNVFDRSRTVVRLRSVGRRRNCDPGHSASGGGRKGVAGEVHLRESTSAEPGSLHCRLHRECRRSRFQSRADRRKILPGIPRRSVVSMPDSPNPVSVLYSRLVLVPEPHLPSPGDISSSCSYQPPSASIPPKKTAAPTNCLQPNVRSTEAAPCRVHSMIVPQLEFEYRTEALLP